MRNFHFVIDSIECLDMDKRIIRRKYFIKLLLLLLLRQDTSDLLTTLKGTLTADAKSTPLIPRTCIFSVL